MSSEQSPGAPGNEPIRRGFGAAASEGPPDGARRPSVLLVTGELVGLHRNGGIGTASTGLAETLAGAGFPVTVLYTATGWGTEVERERWRDAYARIGIELVCLERVERARFDGPLARHGYVVPVAVYAFLRNRAFDIVHFNDNRGEGHLCVAAKRAGFAFRDTLLVVSLQGPCHWALTLNGEAPTGLLDAAMDFGERISIEGADVLITSSDYLVEWIRARGYALPRIAVRQQNIVPTPDPFSAAPAKFDLPVISPGKRAVREIAFFGRLEPRKGIKLFCAALDRCAPQFAAAGVRVTFMGREARIDGQPSGGWLRHRGRDWPFAWTISSALDQPDAIAHLKANACLAVMPSPLDNSPCVVTEALYHGIPFRATRAGGVPELVDERDHDSALFAYDDAALAAALRDAVDRGAAPVRPALDLGRVRAAMISGHLNWGVFLAEAAGDAGRPESRGLSVVVDGKAKPEAVERALRALVPCRPARIVVIDRGLGRSLQAPAGTTCEVLSPAAPTAQACFESLAADDVLLLAPEAVVDPVRVEALRAGLAASRAAALLPFATVGSGPDSRVVPSLGGSVPFGLFEGFAFSGCALVSASWLRRALAEPLAASQPFLGLLDQVVLQGGRVWPWPEPCVTVGAPPQPMHRRTPERASLFARAHPSDLRLIVALGLRAPEHAPRKRKKPILWAIGALAFPLCWAFAAIRSTNGRMLSAREEAGAAVERLKSDLRQGWRTLRRRVFGR